MWRNILLALAVVVGLRAGAYAAFPEFGPDLSFAQSIGSSLITATGTLASRAIADRFAERINVKDEGAKGDAIGLTDGTIAAGASAFSSSLATFKSSDVGKRITLTGSGAAGASQSGTIASFTDAHHVGVSFTATYATPWYGTFAATVSAGGANCVVGDALTLASDGSTITQAVFKVATLSGSAAATVIPSVYGHYTAAPSGLYTTTGSGTCSGVTLTIGGTNQLGGQFTYGTDDSVAIAAAVTLANSRCQTGAVIDVHMPAGAYYLKANTLPLMTCNIGIGGAGENLTTLFVDPAYVGDVFSWSDAWLGSSGAAGFPFDGSTIAASAVTAGPVVRDFRIIGDRTAPTQQNAFMLYDHEDWFLMRNLSVYYIHGRAFCFSCAFKNDTTRYTRESRFDNLRVYNSGMTNVPAIELGAAGAGISNDLRFARIDVYASYGPGIVMRADTGAAMGQNHFSQIRVEGLEWNAPGVAGDLLQIGDTAMGGRVVDTYFDELQLIDPNAGYCALRLTAVSSAMQSYNIFVSNGSVGGGAAYGKGLCIDAGRQSRFQFSDIETNDTNITVGASTLTGPGLVVQGAGDETNWTTNIDPTAVTLIQKGIASALTAAGASKQNLNVSALSVACAPDSTATCGNTRGSNSADLQAIRAAGSQSATGANSYVGPGANNTASAQYCSVINGTSNTCQGTYGMLAGASVVDNGIYGLNCYGTGAIDAPGDAQRCFAVLRGTTSDSTTVQLTSNGLTPTTSNIANITNNAVFKVNISLTAIDHTTVGNNYAWSESGLLTRGAAGNTTAYAPSGSITAVSNGTVTGLAIAETADTTNGGLNLTFTPPTGNTDKWDIVAEVTYVRVQ